ncbi:hypothetical protein ACJMK2_016874 [Sinanodonta woodiana]|uniref:Uncharacterized protein n=1 Tax=Sinanodonta woodiana TaxID=1069815 RepID=A0ABD3UV51_SINWO
MVIFNVGLGERLPCHAELLQNVLLLYLLTPTCGYQLSYQELNTFQILDLSNQTENLLNIVQGVIDTRKEYKVLQVINENDSDVSVYPNMKLGPCESIYIKETTEQRCATVLTKNKDDARDKVPGHLEELLGRSSKHLSNEEKLAFMELLIEYQDVFFPNQKTI